MKNFFEYNFIYRKKITILHYYDLIFQHVAEMSIHFDTSTAPSLMNLYGIYQDQKKINKSSSGCENV